MAGVISYHRGKMVAICLLIVSLFAFSCRNTGKNSADSAVQKPDSEKAVLSFREYEHNFGNVTQGEKVGFIFSFENKGRSDLVIMSATASCGCTVPKFDSRPVAPAESGELEVVFDTEGRSGVQSKTITVKSNATVPVVLLKIVANIVPDKESE
jgi:hypothetical protein